MMWQYLQREPHHDCISAPLTNLEYDSIRPSTYELKLTI